MRVLLVEDNLDLCASLADAMESKNIVVDYAYDGKTGLNLVEENEYEVIILDINLPQINGIEVCRRIREDLQKQTPIIMLTARADIDDKLSSFDAGADDYLVKPFETLELIARLNIISKRKVSDSNILKVGDLEFDQKSMKITREGKAIELNSSCRKLLSVLMKKSPEVVSKQSLEYALWGDESPEAEVLKIHIHNLRQKIDKPFAREYLKTVRGSGYQLIDH